jgi:hypothetical protein
MSFKQPGAFHHLSIESLTALSYGGATLFAFPTKPGPILLNLPHNPLTQRFTILVLLFIFLVITFNQLSVSLSSTCGPLGEVLGAHCRKIYLCKLKLV